MRTAKLDHLISSDIDLTQLSSRRVTITRETGATEDLFRVTSTLNFLKCERSEFIGRYLKRKRSGLKYIKGNCSSPSGYYWLPTDQFP